MRPPPIDSVSRVGHDAAMNDARAPETCLLNRMEHARQLIGMLHVPVTNLLAAPGAWLERLGLPRLTAKDAVRMADIEREHAANPVHPAPHPSTRELSFLGFLVERMLAEADAYARHGLTAMQLENVGAPYAMGNGIGAVEIAVMDHLSGVLRKHLPRASLGLQILSAGGEQALRIALRRQLDYIRVEGVLFGGVRPEGPLSNAGGLHALHALRRKEHLRGDGRDTDGPRIFVDLLKKHTAFPSETQSLDLWLQNIVFMKMEGVIITGSETGRAADETMLVAADGAVREVREQFGVFVPLLTGSGATPDNIAMYARYAHGVIAGSYVKKDGYWENPLDEQRVERLAGAAAQAGFAMG